MSEPVTHADLLVMLAGDAHDWALDTAHSADAVRLSTHIRAHFGRLAGRRGMAAMLALAIRVASSPGGSVESAIAAMGATRG